MDGEKLSYGYRFLFMLLIIGVNGFFAAAEAALLSVRPSRLKQLAAEGQVGAQAAMSLLANPERLLSVTQVGLTLASLEIQAPSLDDVFLAKTGRSLEGAAEAESEAAEPAA